MYTFLSIKQIDLLITDKQTDKKLIEEMYSIRLKKVEQVLY
ncbi:hypothetical protein JNUCC77_18485 (plasmid) [Enterococcus alishanensis]